MRRATVCCFLLVAGPAFAGEAERLRQEIASLEFLNRLELTREQAAALLPFAERGAYLRRELDRQRDQASVRFHDALVRFREEDLKDEGLSFLVIAEAGGLDHALKLLGSRTAAALAPLEEHAAAHLSPAQRALALPRIDDCHPLDLLRTRRGTDYDDLRDDLARALANARVAEGLASRHARRDLRLRLTRLLDQVKDWNDWEYAQRREDLLRSLVPGYERAQVAAEIHRIYLARYGRVGLLADHLFREPMLAVLAERAGIDAPVLPDPDGRFTVAADVDEVNRKIAELKADINLLNLMNGLHLDREQLRAIGKAARACVPEGTRARAEDNAPRLVALREAYAALRRGEPVPAAVRAKLQSDAEKRGWGYLAARRRELEETRAKGIESLVEVLSPEQGEVIRTYAPCLVPPRNLRDPVRAGQANDTEALEALVDRLRTLDLSGDPRAAADRVVKAIELHDGKLPAAERNARLALVVDVAREAQSLDDVGYAARRAELALRLRPIDRMETLKERLLELEGEEKVIREKICAFLLDPRIVPLVEERIERLEKATTANVPVPKAEGCKEGECGKP
jgi:hypothetical protein